VKAGPKKSGEDRENKLTEEKNVETPQLTVAID